MNFVIRAKSTTAIKGRSRSIEVRDRLAVGQGSNFESKSQGIIFYYIIKDLGLYSRTSLVRHFGIAFNVTWDSYLGVFNGMVVEEGVLVIVDFMAIEFIKVECNFLAMNLKAQNSTIEYYSCQFPHFFNRISQAFLSVQE